VARITVKDDAGLKAVKRVPLNAETAAAAREEVRTVLVECSEDRLRHVGRCPKSPDQVEQTYEQRLATSGKKLDTMGTEHVRLKQWCESGGHLTLDRIRPYWNRYRPDMLHGLQPADGLEAVLAGRFLLTGWRQRRAVHSEIEQIRLAQESAVELAGVRVGLERDWAAQDVEEVLSEDESSSKAWEDLQRSAIASNEMGFSPEHVGNLLWRFHDQLGLKDNFNDCWQRLREPGGLDRGLHSGTCPHPGRTASSTGTCMSFSDCKPCAQAEPELD
jgi:hypothetical protein